MEKIKLKIEKLPHCFDIPKYQTEGSSGMDLSAAIKDFVKLAPMERKLIPTGIKLEFPTGYEAQVRPRSGLSIKCGLTLINCIGTIDADYRGEVCVPLVNLSNEVQTIKRGDRIAQMVIMPVISAEIIVQSELGETQRGSGGFGSTGLN